MTGKALIGPQLMGPSPVVSPGREIHAWLAKVAPTGLNLLLFSLIAEPGQGHPARRQQWAHLKTISSKR